MKRLIQAETRVAAATMGFVSPEDAYRLADLAEVVVDDDGSVSGVKKALEKLAKDKPYLLDGKRDGSPGTPPRSGTRAPAGPGQRQGRADEDRPIIHF